MKTHVRSWLVRRLPLLAVALSCSLALVLGGYAWADGNSSWLSRELGLTEIRTLPASELPPYSVNGNRDCLEQTVLTRPSRLLPTPLSQQAHQSCVVDTLFGSVSTSGYLARPGTELYGLIKTASGQTLPVIPVIHDDIGLAVTGSVSGGTYLNVILHFNQTLTSSLQTDGQLVITSSLAGSQLLHDASGSPLPVQSDSLSYSPNGQWLLIDLPAIGMARVNLDTLEVLPFGEPVRYGTGSTPAFQTSITSDGRYAAVASRSLSLFRLYDLTTCAPIPTHLTAPVACQFRDLYTFMASKVSGFNGIVSTVRFINQDALSLYAADGQGTVRQYRLSNPDGQFGRYQYLSLGDSFASGEGAYSYKVTTDTANNHCHVSQRSYPYLLGRQKTLTGYESVACSGARLDDVTSTDTRYPGQTKDQLPRSSRDTALLLGNFIPGMLPQREFASHYLPNVITLSVGGNNFGFGAKIKRCLMPDTCYASYEQRLGLVRELHTLYYTLVGAYQELLSSGDPKTQWYVVGYPQLVKPGGNCGLNVLLNQDELLLAQHLVTDLNTTLRAAAARAGMRFIDVETALTGHRLCEASGADLAVNGLTAGDDFINFGFLHGPLGNESYHPNAYGQSLMEQAILGQITSFDEPRLAPQPTATLPPEATATVLSGLAAPASPPTIARPLFVPFASTTEASVGQTVPLQPSSQQISLAPNSSVQVSLEPTNTPLGSLPISSTGEAAGTITLPPGVPDGFYLLHAVGTTTSGEPIDLYQDLQITSLSPPSAVTTAALTVDETSHVAPSAEVPITVATLDVPTQPELRPSEQSSSANLPTNQLGGPLVQQQQDAASPNSPGSVLGDQAQLEESAPAGTVSEIAQANNSPKTGTQPRWWWLYLLLVLAGLVLSTYWCFKPRRRYRLLRQQAVGQRRLTSKRRGGRDPRPRTRL